LWDVATGDMLRRFLGHSSAVLSVVFSPQGNMALSGSGDTSVALWDIEPYPGGLVFWTEQNRFVPDLTCDQREIYRVEPACDDAGVFPTRTPLPPLES